MAIVTASAKVSAHVAAFGRVKPSKFEDSGPIQSIKFVSMDGTKEHWATYKAEQAKQFTMQQPVNLIPAQRNGRETYDIEILEPIAQPKQPTGYQPVTSKPLGFHVAPVAPRYQPQTAPAPAPQPMQQLEQGPDKAAIAAWITGQSKLYSYCYSQAAAALPDGVPDAAVQGGASTLYISTCRKFGLER